MAAIYGSSQRNSWIVSVKIALISTGVLSVAVVLKLSVPVVADFVSSEVPSLWTFLLSWLKPPYLYLLINFIIASIVASSKLHHRSSSSAPAAAGDGDILKISGQYGSYDYAAENAAEADIVAERLRVSGDESASAAATAWNNSPQRKDSLDLSSLLSENEKPPVSARFGLKKSVKASPEGAKPLGVSRRAKKQDTLESTWKTITEGRAIPLARHLKKSDTLDSHVRRSQIDENTPPPPPPPTTTTKTMKKSETFPDGPSPAKVRREPSLSQDELNRRVEAFIRKFNEEMRLQRQESLNQYQEMIRRGAH